MQKTAIIILNFNTTKDTLECLGSIYRSEDKNLDITVIDNGSEKSPLLEIKDRFPDVFVIENRKNLGFAEGCNIGIKRAISKNIPYILLLNNDTTVSKNLVKHFKEAIEKHKRAGILGAKIVRYHEKETIDHIGGIWSYEKAQFTSLGFGKDIDSENLPRAVDYVSGCCIFIKREVFEKIGYFDTRYFLLWEEADLCARAKRAGFEIWTVPKAVVWHKISSSFPGGKVLSEYYWWRNRLLWIETQLVKREKIKVFSSLFRDILKLYLKLSIKEIKIGIKRYPKKKELEKLYKYRSAAKGVSDYIFRRFGCAPNSISPKKEGRH